MQQEKTVRCAGQDCFQTFRRIGKVFDDGFTIRKRCNGLFDGFMNMNKLLPIFKCQPIGENGEGLL
ncbi:hypothetical protein Q644_00100 [Brucella intermedia 229E]|uniref:Uncharacterized protein n=1 Tax=Brucella intermedia 229E TaxID=1337887 RepID=U4VLM4_9HYPH|nr:hypothetical protein Q644_00100 [Brucella intermedia 229E]